MNAFTETDAYVRYLQRVRHARAAGYSDKAIMEELVSERISIAPRCTMKQAMLVGDRNPNKSREAARAARECIEAIDKLLAELAPKENNA